MMAWRRKEPRHQKLLYWHIPPEIISVSPPKKVIFIPSVHIFICVFATSLTSVIFPDPHILTIPNRTHLYNDMVELTCIGVMLWDPLTPILYSLSSNHQSMCCIWTARDWRLSASSGGGADGETENDLFIYIPYIDGSVQERLNSSASAMELRLSCTSPSISYIASF